MNDSHVRYATLLPEQPEVADLDRITIHTFDVRQETSIKLWKHLGAEALNDEHYRLQLTDALDDHDFAAAQKTALIDNLRQKHVRETKAQMAREQSMTQLANSLHLNLDGEAAHEFIAEPGSQTFEDIDNLICGDDHNIDLSPAMRRLLDLYDTADDVQREIIRTLVQAGVEKEQTGTMTANTRQKLCRAKKIARQHYGWNLDPTILWRN